MTYLVDANVLCEPTRSAPDPGVMEWLRRNEREIVVDPVILGEIRFGILLLPQAQVGHAHLVVGLVVGGKP